MLCANWIRPDRPMGEASPIFRKTFSVNKPVKAAVLEISARGVYEATLNGRRVGNFIMAPGWTDYRKRIQLQRYEVTEMLRKTNRLCIQTANGWYIGAEEWRKNGRAGAESGEAAVIAELTLQFEDGDTETVATDETWETAESGLRYCDLYNGQIFDATVVPEFLGWSVISKNNDRSMLIPQQGEEVIENERLKPVKIITTPRGETVLDFGQNLTGYLEFEVDAEKNDSVSFSFAEVLDADGNFYNENYRTAKALYRYTCRDGKQTYKPSLTFYGFRYVRIDRFPGEISAESFTAIVVHSALKRTGSIHTSDEMLNRLFHNIIWGQKGNYLDVPTDCPQRNERLGWLGDAQIFIRTASYNFNVYKFFRKWLEDMKSEQREDGSLFGVVPGVFTTHISAAWGDAVTICPWQLYLSYGKAEILELMFDPMKKWVNYITSVTTEKNLWFGGQHFGDWLELKAPYGSYKGETRDDLVASAFYAYSAELVCKAGRALKRDIAEYEELHQNIVKAFKDIFKDIFYTQTEAVLALYFNLTDYPEMVSARLAEMIHGDGDKLQTGFVGTPYILHALSSNGYSELAYKLLLRREYPSWIYPITKGATTMWEHWDGIKPDGRMWSSDMNSFNHYAYGAVGDWMYGVCGGIKPDENHPGFERLIYEPIATDRLDSFCAELETDYGKIRSEWHHEDGGIVYELTTPVETAATVGGKRYLLRPGVYTFRD